MPRQNRKRRKLTKHIPDEKYHLGCKDAEVIDLTDMRHEYTLVSSRLELIRRQPELLAASREYLITPKQKRIFTACRTLPFEYTDSLDIRAGRLVRLWHVGGA